MKNTFLKTIGGAALGILMLVVLAQISVSAQGRINNLPVQENSSEGEGARALEGSWNTQVTFRSCQTFAALSPPFASMNTFMQGGTMQEFGVASGLFRGPGHGIWNHEGGRNYSTSFQFFRFNLEGTYAERVVVRRQIELNPGSSYVATSYIEFYDTNGNLLRRGCATETATPFK